MEFAGEEWIAAPRDAVWAALNDPDVLKQCIPGCHSMEMTGVNEFAPILKLRIGPLAATFNGTLTLDDAHAPDSYTIDAEGKGGVAGFAKGRADVRLIEEGAETLLTYKVTAQVGGRLAKLGGKFIHSAAKKLVSRFFERFGEIVGAGG